jgi:hypothetical protein
MSRSVEAGVLVAAWSGVAVLLVVAGGLTMMLAPVALAAGAHRLRASGVPLRLPHVPHGAGRTQTAA